VRFVCFCGVGNKAGCYLKVADYAEGGRKGVIWIPEGCKGWGWSRVVGELWQLLKFIEAKGESLVSEAHSSKGKQKGGISLIVSVGLLRPSRRWFMEWLSSLQCRWFRR
jgi:hypothetical protein